MCIFNTGTLHEVALWKDWPKFTPTQQRECWLCTPRQHLVLSVLKARQPEKRRQLLKSVPFWASFWVMLVHACP